MRCKIYTPVICLLFTIVGTMVRADDPPPLELNFDKPLKGLSRSKRPVSDAWGYYLSAPDDTGASLKKKEDVDRHITAAPKIDNSLNKDTSACRLQSSRNYVGLARLVDPAYQDAKQLSWKWSVAKHPHNGKLRGTPNDQAMTIHVFFRSPKTDVPKPDPQNLRDYDYTVLGFTWTHNTKSFQETMKGKTAWRGMPKGDIYYTAIQNGVIDGELSETIDLKAEYKKAFKGKEAPSIWGLVIMADSNAVAAEVGEMTTDAIIREIKLSK